MVDGIHTYFNFTHLWRFKYYVHSSTGIYTHIPHNYRDSHSIFTHLLDARRDVAMGLRAGVVVTAAVSATTERLVAGPGAGNKVAEVEARNVLILDEDQFQAAIVGAPVG